MDTTVIIVAFAAGYVAAVYTWSKIRLWVVGAAAEAVALRNRAAALESKIKGIL